MKTRDFEKTFADSVSAYVETEFPGFKVVRSDRDPVGFRTEGVPPADLWIIDPKSGRKLAIEVKDYSGTLPIGSVPYIQVSNTAFRKAGSGFMLVTTSEVPVFLKESIGETGADVLSNAHPEILISETKQRLSSYFAPAPGKMAITS